jgi:hypothetical protein
VAKPFECFRRKGEHFAPQRRSGTRRLTVGALAGVLLAALLPGAAVVGLADAAEPDPCVTPNILERYASQGLPGGTDAAPLVVGKDTVVKLHLALPSNCTISPVVTFQDVSLQVAGTSIKIPPLKPVAPLTYRGSAAQPNSDSDPVFVVPGSVLQALGQGARTTITFSVSMSFVSVPGGSGTLATTVSSVLEKKTRALRVLAVPVGDSAQGFDRALTPEGTNAVTKGFSAMARLLPVPDGTADLADPTSTAGVRYRINQSVAHVAPSQQVPGTGKWCMTEALFAEVAKKLDIIRDQWNTANPAHMQADRVVGIGDASLWFRSGARPGCYDGLADINSVHAFARAAYDAPGSIEAGALLTHELVHTWNLQETSGGHSPNLYADTTPTGRSFRAVNTDTGAWIGEPRAIMQFLSPFRDDTTLLERVDFTKTLCLLGGMTTCPARTATFGSVVPSTSTSTMATASSSSSGNDTRVVVSGVLAGGVASVHSFMTTATDLAGAQSQPDPSSAYSFVGTTASGRTVTFPFTATSQSAGAGPLDAATKVCDAARTPCIAFSFAVGVGDDDSDPLQHFELIGPSGPFLTRSRSARPTIQSVNVTTAESSRVALASGAEPAISNDGTLVAYVDPAGCIRVKSLGGLQLEPTSCTLGQQPSWSHDGLHLVFVQDGRLMRGTRVGADVLEVQPIGACLAVSVAGSGCALVADAPVMLESVRNPSWSQASLPHDTHSELVAFDAVDPRSGGRAVYVINPGVVDGQLRGLYPAYKVLSDAVDPAFSHRPSPEARRGELIATQADQLVLVDAVAALSELGGSEQEPSTVLPGRAASWGDRYIALEAGPSIALADFNPENPTPGAVVQTAGAPAELVQKVVFQDQGQVWLLQFDHTKGRKITVRGTDDRPEEARVAFFLVCGAPAEAAMQRSQWPIPNRFTDPIAVDVQAVRTGSSLFEASFVYDADKFVCDDGEDVVLAAARANDGFLDSGIVVGGPLRPPRDSVPRPAIVYPRDGEAVGRHPVVFLGGVEDAYDGSVPDESFAWVLYRDGLQVDSFKGRAPGARTDLPDGRYRAALTVKNARNREATTTVDFLVLNNPTPASFEPHSLSLPDTSKASSVVTVFRLLDAYHVVGNFHVALPPPSGARPDPFTATEAKALDNKIILKFPRAELSRFLEQTRTHGSVVQIAVEGEAMALDGSKVHFFAADPSHPCVYLQNSGGNPC